MKKVSFKYFIAIIICLPFINSCKEKTNLCADIVGNYTGVIEGNFETKILLRTTTTITEEVKKINFIGTINLSVTQEFDEYRIRGNWAFIDDETGDEIQGFIQNTPIFCGTGNIYNIFYLSEGNPSWFMCPPTNSCRTNSDVRLGDFEGIVNPDGTGGTGIWDVNSSSAEEREIMGSGTWTVTKD